jgi:hypothetical protein
VKDTSPKYRLYLRPQNFGDKTQALFAALKQIVPELGWDYELFESQAQYSDPIYFWHYLTSQQVEKIREHFAKLEIVLDTKTVSSTFLFPVDQLDGFSNNWYSGDLISLEEDALLDWAEFESIEEAYRFTLLPSFDPPITVRVWAEGGVHKKGSKMSGVPGTISKTKGWIPTQDSWYQLRHMMEKYNFWTAASWDTVPEGYAIVDGEVLLFEGYKNGHFKFLYDHSPDDGAAYALQEIFLNLKPDSK